MSDDIVIIELFGGPRDGQLIRQPASLFYRPWKELSLSRTQERDVYVPMEGEPRRIRYVRSEPLDS